MMYWRSLEPIKTICLNVFDQNSSAIISIVCANIVTFYAIYKFNLSFFETLYLYCIESFVILFFVVLRTLALGAFSFNFSDFLKSFLFMALQLLFFGAMLSVFIMAVFYIFYRGDLKTPEDALYFFEYTRLYLEINFVVVFCILIVQLVYFFNLFTNDMRYRPYFSVTGKRLFPRFRYIFLTFFFVFFLSYITNMGREVFRGGDVPFYWVIALFFMKTHCDLKYFLKDQSDYERI